MSLIELIVFLTTIALGVLFARALYPHGIVFAIVGFVCGFAIIPSIWIAHVRYRRWLYVGDKGMPDCVCGNSVFRVEKVGADFHLLCKKCSRRYQRIRRQVWVFDGDEKKLYRQLIKHRGWV